MFETSVVREQVAPQRRARFFVASIVAHTVVVTGVIVATATSSSLPTKSPNEMMKVYVVPASPPLPKGNPDAPRQSQPAQQHQQAPQQHTQTAPAQITTPNKIPESIPTVPTSTAGDVTSGNSTVATGERWGDPNGDEHGVDVGQSASGVGSGIPDVVYQPSVDVKSAIVLLRVQPAYPRAAIAAKIPGWVILKCIVGKTGEVRDIEVVKSSMAMFEQPGIEALRGWKFAPGYFRGQTVDTYFELKITWEVR